MLVLVIGLGSMGKRRIRLLKHFFGINEIIGVDNQKERCLECEKIFSIQTSMDLDEVIKNNDFFCAFVCTSPLSHYSIIKFCLEKNLHVFTEISLFSNGYDELINLAKVRNKLVFQSSTLIYREEISYIKRKVMQTEGKKNYIYHIGQYLPDWHPWENYKDFFIGDKRTNGCREILAIELPWLIQVFGKVKKFYVLADKMTDLKIDYKDCYHLLMLHEDNTVGSLIVDVVSRKAVRNIEVFGERIFIEWDGTSNGMKDYDIREREDRNIINEVAEHIDGYADFVDEMAYVNELRTFFRYIEEGKLPPYTMEDDYITLQLIEEIEKTIYE